MALPHVPYAAQTAPTMSELDDTFAALGALSIIPCTATGLSNQALTPKTTPSTPTVSAYADNQVFSFVPANGNLGPVTINVNGLGALNLYLPNGSQVSQANSLRAGTLYIIAYSLQLNSGVGGFQLLSGNSAGKLAQRIVTAFSTSSQTTLSGIGTGANVTAADGVQAAIAVIAPISASNQILARATINAAASGSGRYYVIVAQGSNVIGASLAGGALVDTPMPTTVETNFVLQNTSSISFQARIVPQTNSRGVSTSINQGNINFQNVTLISSLILEEWTTGT